jgi:hypothetical protein
LATRWTISSGLSWAEAIGAGELGGVVDIPSNSFSCFCHKLTLIYEAFFGNWSSFWEANWVKVCAWAISQ